MENQSKQEVATSILRGDAAAPSTSAVGAAFANLISGGGINTNQPGGKLSNVTDTRVLAELIDNFSDTESIDGDLVGMNSNVIQMNQTARDFIFEPATLEILASIHAPYKFTLDPINFTFDANGNIVIGTNTGTSALLILDGSVQPGIIGWAFRYTSADTLNTSTNLNVSTSEGVDISSKLRDGNKEGWFVVLGHVKDVETSLTNTDAFSSPQFEFTVNQVNTSVNQQFTFDPSGKAKFTLTGRNANVDVYAIFPNREVLALVRGLYYGDQMDALPAALVALYSQVSNAQ